MANEKVSKGLLLYFSTLDCIEKVNDEELGRFIKSEMNWLAGNTEEPVYNEIGSFFLHSRIKEQIALRGYEAERKRKSRENKKQAMEPEISVYTPKEDEVEDSDSDTSQSEVDFGRSMVEMWKADRRKAEKTMNDECSKRGYNFYNVLEVVRNG